MIDCRPEGSTLLPRGDVAQIMIIAGIPAQPWAQLSGMKRPESQDLRATVA
jgi:hypothetical protein